MITETISLHRNSEEAFIKVEPNDAVDQDGRDNKIKITYDEAITEIYNLSRQDEYKKYFYKMLNLPEEEGKPRLLGAAVDKSIGKTIIVVKTINGASLIEKNLNSDWIVVDDTLTDNGTDLRNEKFDEDYRRIIVDEIIATRNFGNEQIGFILAYMYDNEIMDDDDIQDAYSMLTNGKTFQPIDQRVMYDKLVNLNECFASSPKCYTINFHDIVSRVVNVISKVKNARSKIDSL